MLGMVVLTALILRKSERGPQRDAIWPSKNHPKPLPSVINVTYHTFVTYDRWHCGLNLFVCYFWLVFVRFVLQLNWGRVSDFSSGGRGPRMGCESVLGYTVRQTSSKYRVYSISRYLWYLWHIYDVSSWYFYYMFYLLHRFMIYLSDQSIQKKAAKNGDHSPGLIAYRPSVFIWRFQMISWRGMGSKNWCIFTKLYIVTLGKRTWVERPGWNMFPKCILPSVRWLMVQVCLFFEANACSNHSWIRGFLRCISPLWISKDSKWSMTL